MPPPLIAAPWRRRASAAAVAGIAVFLSLAVLVFHASRTAFDAWAFRVLPGHISDSHAQFLIGFTDPALSVVLLTLLVVLALSARRVELAVLAVAGPALGTVLASDVLKPLIRRTLFDGTAGSFPSGHETGVTCTATVLLVAFGQLPVRRAGRYVLAALLGLWVVVSAVGLTRFYYHYATDTIGAVGFSVAFVLGLALLLDRYRLPRRRPPATPAGTARPPGVRPRPGPGTYPRPANHTAGTAPAARRQLTPRS